MANKSMVRRLVHMRGLKLRDEVARLKAHSTELAGEERKFALAIEAASETITSSSNSLGDLGALGEVRLASIRRATELKNQVAIFGGRVSRARKLLDSAELVERQVREEIDQVRERSLDAEAEAFASWQTKTPQRS